MNADTNYADLFYSNIVNDIDTLEKNVNEFPCSSLARFLLLYHYKKNNNPGFEELAKHTGIYINNPLWIQYQLSKIDTDHLSKENNKYSFEIENKNQQPLENIPPAAEEPRLTESLGQEINQIPVSESEVAEEKKKEDFYEGEKRNETIEENIPPSAEEKIMPIPVLENQLAEEEKKEGFYEGENQNHIPEENIPVATEEPRLTESFGQEIIPISVSENEVAEEEKKEGFYEGENQNYIPEENIPTAAEEPRLTESFGQEINQIPVSENQVAEEEKKEDFYKGEKQNEIAEENISPAAEEPRLTESFGQEINQIPVSENEIAGEEKNEDFYEGKYQNHISEENIYPAKEEPRLTESFGQEINQIPVLENQVAEEEKKEDDSNSIKEDEELIAFEPLHTVDYFASQGIKISEEDLENDHLGKQVKSFTAWLKSMKRLHPGQLPEQNEVIEKIIQASAEASNQNANVLTEAMAEVLIKQNKRGKAIEMYEKLSLMNPSKSAYFAAKIESLKII